MVTTNRVLGLAAGLFALVAAGGCASLAGPGRGDPLPTAHSPSLEGIWEGQVWENPSDYRQGVQNIRLDMSRTGSWTATTKGAECARGVATVRSDLVILHSRAEAGATAMADLIRVRERPPESASAPSQR